MLTTEEQQALQKTRAWIAKQLDDLVDVDGDKVLVPSESRDWYRFLLLWSQEIEQLLTEDSTCYAGK